MKRFAASDEAKGIFYVATRACPDIRPEFVDAVQLILLLPNMECVSCYHGQTTMIELVQRVGEKIRLTKSTGNMGVVMFLYPNATAKQRKRDKIQARKDLERRRQREEQQREEQQREEHARLGKNHSLSWRRLIPLVC